jgi:hypothetical protein
MCQSRTDDQIRARLIRFIEHVVRVGFATRPARSVTRFEYMRAVVLDNRHLAQHNEEEPRFGSSGVFVRACPFRMIMIAALSCVTGRFDCDA